MSIKEEKLHPGLYIYHGPMWDTPVFIDKNQNVTWLEDSTGEIKTENVEYLSQFGWFSPAKAAIYQNI
jgi:hypothetical protein